MTVHKIAYYNVCNQITIQHTFEYKSQEELTNQIELIARFLTEQNGSRNL